MVGVSCPVPATADTAATDTPAAGTLSTTPDRVDGTTGAPLGGFGAGAVKFDAKTGTFAATTRPPADQTDYTRRGDSAFELVTATSDGVAASRRLTAPEIDGRYLDDAIWPEHRVDFGTAQGVAVTMTAFSPMASDDLDAMSMPYAFYDVTLANTRDDDATASIALHWDDPAVAGAEVVEGKGFASDSWAVLADADDDAALVTAGSGDDFFETGEADGTPIGESSRTAVKVSLRPHAETHVRFVLSWYDDSDPEAHHYLGQVDDPTEVAELGLGVPGQEVGASSGCRREDPRA
ncbi:GH116 family glycosyl-hydrolase [Isoptericola sp. NPDC019482]|uniref:GH116 family glycosyl-hydrolase n=1 Tax=Isoptericola sp. NPDC019482 TaxID=3154688 RepID=UPI00346F925E